MALSLDIKIGVSLWSAHAKLKSIGFEKPGQARMAAAATGKA
jgi:hypothetical protein